MNTNPNRLRDEQYADGRNLSARSGLHARFSTNPYGWMKWVFDQFDFPEDAKVLELGCGPGFVWRENFNRNPPGWQVLLSDFSEGMIAEAKDSLSSNASFCFEVLDAQDVPHEDDHFDAVIANHMLYHVPDRPKALGEIRRVLKSNGQLYAATNGPRHMQELYEIVRRHIPDLAAGSEGFTLENGVGQLSEHFENVEVRFHEDSLVVTEAEPLCAYARSMVGLGDADEQQIARVEKDLSARIAAEGKMEIAKHQGMFVAS